MARAPRKTVQALAATRKSDARPRPNVTKRRGASADPNTSLSTVIRNQEMLMRQYEQLRRQTLGAVNNTTRRGRRLSLPGGRGQRANLAVQNRPRIATTRRMQRQQSGGQTANANNSPNQNRLRRQDSSSNRRGRGGRRGGGRAGGRPVTQTELDAQLDAYMGDDVQKQRLDNELDAYFSRADDIVPSGSTQASKPGEQELGEIAPN